MRLSSLLAALGAARITAAAAIHAHRAEISSCASAVAAILNSSDPGISCLAPAALSAVILEDSIDHSIQTTVVSSLDTWLTQMCAASPCSADTLARVAANLTLGCGASFENIAIPSGSALASGLQQVYPVFRDYLCLKQSAANGSYCLTERTNILPEFNGDPVAGLAQIAFSADMEDHCNECTKAAFQRGAKSFPVTSIQTAGLTAVCGANFTAAINDPVVGITQTAVGDTLVSGSGSKNGVRRVAMPAATALLVIASCMSVFL